MEKIIKRILICIIIVVAIVVLKNPISLGLMHIVDFIGYATGINVVDVIDFLNTIYYL